MLRPIYASLGFLERYLYLIKRYLGWELVFLLYQIVNALTIALIGVASGNPQAVLYLTVGALLWGFLSVLFNEVGAIIAIERWEGTIEYSLMAPIPRSVHLLSLCAGAAVYGLLRTLVVLVAMAFFLNLDLSHANLFTALAVLLASSLSFIGLGLVAAVLPLLSPDRGAQASHIFQALILLISGVYYEITILPPMLQKLAMLSPATYALEAMRKALLHGASLAEVTPTLVLLTVMGLALFPVGLWVFGLGERYAMRHGGLSRKG